MADVRDSDARSDGDGDRERTASRPQLQRRESRGLHRASMRERNHRVPVVTDQGDAMRHVLSCLAALLVVSPSLLAQSPDGFVPLFDGKTLNGWVVQNESKNFTVSDGILTVHGTSPTT